MFEKMSAVEARYEALEKQVCDPATAADTQKNVRLMKELKRLAPAVETFRRYKKELADAEEARAILEDGGADGELKALAQEAFDEARAAAGQSAQALRILLLPRDEKDERNVIVEIRQSAGGEESALFAAVLFRMYCMYAERVGWKTEVMYRNPTQLGGYKEISFLISGENAYGRFKFESGVHRVQRIPVTESNGKIQTSTVTVAVLPEAREVDVQINPADLQIDTFRSSGAGGQHINKTESAIRITHLPTGLVVECQDERSQYKNKDKAMKVLRSRLLEAELEKENSARAGLRRSQVGTGDRSERIRTYNFPQGRVTDHRIGLTLYKIDAILNGGMEELIDALITADTAEKLKASEENDDGNAGF